MAPRFLGKTSLDGLQLLEVNGRPVLDDYARLRDLLQARAPAAAGLLAEPIGDWKSSEASVVSWYAEASNDPLTLATLSGGHRQQLEAQLRSAMGALLPLLNDPATGPVLRRALVLPTADGIKAVGSRIVLTDWGMTTAGTVVPAEPLQLSPLAAFLPASDEAPYRPRVVPPQIPPPPRQPAPPPSSVATPLQARSVWNWWLIPASITVAALFLVLGLWLGSRQVAERLAAQPTVVALFDEAQARAALERQLQQNAALENELQERRRALSADVCTADPAQMPRIGPDHAAVVPPAATPIPPGGQPFHGNLAELLAQSVVMVIGPRADATETGSGFFVTPELIVTNRHVVEDALPGKLLVAGGKLATATHADLVAESPSSTIGELDIALLRIQPQPGVQPLAMSTVAAALDPVVAAGFPGLTMHGDDAAGRLLQGDVTAVPTVILTDGKISAIQTATRGLKIMPHTAAVSGGNSGGPLVDACGRVVGVNTFITADQEQVAHTNYAQKSDALIAFLQANGVTVNVVNEPCSPQPPPPAPGSASPSVGATPATTPGTPSPTVPAAAPQPAATQPAPSQR
jgi:S1-C subfamily serine protease